MSYQSMKKSSSIYLLIIILGLAFLLRVIFLGTIPNGFYCDEASNGYDTYSILQTGRDRYGEFLPLFLKGFGNDYRESIYVFLTLPFIKFFGLNELATRLTAAVIGTITVITVYYLAKECLSNKVGLIAALFLAISPWHIQFSRIAFRAILLPWLLCLGVLFFAKSFRKPKYLSLSSLFFALSLYTYSSARVFVSLFVLGLSIIFWQHLWRHRVQTLMALILFLLIFIPLFIVWISPEGMVRVRAVEIETNPVNIIHNYLSYVSPNFLFFKGDPNLRHSPEHIGELHYFELVTVPLGIFFLLRENRKERAILMLWLFLYPIPAALTEPAHAIRSIVGAPLLAIISAYGFTQLIDWLRFKRRVLFSTTFAIVALSLAIFCQRYFSDYPLKVTEEWQHGIREAITYAEKSSYDCVIITDNDYHCLNLYNFSAFIPFYTQYIPAKYQLSPTLPWGQYETQNINFDKYSMVSISRQSELNERCLFIIRPEEVKSIVAKGYNYKEVHLVKDSRGVEYFKLIEISK